MFAAKELISAAKLTVVAKHYAEAAPGKRTTTWFELAPARAPAPSRPRSWRYPRRYKSSLRSLLVCIRHSQNRALGEVLSENLHANRKLFFRHANRNGNSRNAR